MPLEEEEEEEKTVLEYDIETAENPQTSVVTASGECFKLLLRLLVVSSKWPTSVERESGRNVVGQAHYVVSHSP